MPGEGLEVGLLEQAVAEPQEEVGAGEELLQRPPRVDPGPGFGEELARPALELSAHRLARPLAPALAGLTEAAPGFFLEGLDEELAEGLTLLVEGVAGGGRRDVQRQDALPGHAQHQPLALDQQGQEDDHFLRHLEAAGEPLGVAGQQALHLQAPFEPRAVPQPVLDVAVEVGVEQPPDGAVLDRELVLQAGGGEVAQPLLGPLHEGGLGDPPVPELGHQAFDVAQEQVRGREDDRLVLLELVQPLGVEQVGEPVVGDDGLAAPRHPVDDERELLRHADELVLRLLHGLVDRLRPGRAALLELGQQVVPDRARGFACGFGRGVGPQVEVVLHVPQLARLDDERPLEHHAGLDRLSPGVAVGLRARLAAHVQLVDRGLPADHRGGAGDVQAAGAEVEGLQVLLGVEEVEAAEVGPVQAVGELGRPLAAGLVDRPVGGGVDARARGRLQPLERVVDALYGLSEVAAFGLQFGVGFGDGNHALPPINRWG